MVSATAQKVQRSDTVLTQELLNRFHDRLLNPKDALRLQKCFSRIIEVDVFDIKICNQARAVPKRPVNFKAAVQKQI